mmetsp:Transcript_20083/g.29045  ORF Transcript_20083/g.29045 Transcript_20083/m.29045 type:complete len:158 (-) Transcript_20083:759-1232(-)
MGFFSRLAANMTAKKEAWCSGLFPDRTLEALSNIIVSTGAKVVLSSTWRARKQFIEDILLSFRRYGETFGGPLVSMIEFYSFTDPLKHTERQWEIHDWLLAHPESVHSWVALDDEELIEEVKNLERREIFIGHVVKTKSDVGLTIHDAQSAIRVLNA